MRKQDIFVLDNPKAPISEAFRTLRTNLQFLDIDGDIKSIVVTSSIPEEGKSSISVNLAISMAQLDKKVLLVDCDLRKPVIHKFFKLSNRQGLTNILVKKEDFKDNINSLDGFDNLDILTSGPKPPNPSELLNSRVMKDFIEEIGKSYDLVLIDSPPIGVVSDGTILSKIADGTLLVVSARTTDRRLIKKSQDQLEKVDARLLGAILNKVQDKDSQGYYYYYGDENY